MDGLRSDAARNRERIVEVARRLATEGDGLGLNAVARAAGVGVGTVYRHFATVEELQEAVVHERFAELAEILGGAAPAQLEQVLTAHFSLLTEDALFEKVTARTEPALERTVEMRAALIDRLARLLDQCRAEGTLSADVDAAGVLLLVCGLAHAARSAGAAADSPQSQFLLRVLLDGLRPPAAR